MDFGARCRLWQVVHLHAEARHLRRNLAMPTADSRRNVALLLFCSGFCALIYQTVWLREFRLIFGASTAASAAVLGIFMGGLGLGSAFLGWRTERSRKPLVFYGDLELLIGLAAAVTPMLVWFVRQAYGLTGGTVVLGQFGSTVIRLILAALVLIVPTFLMGGTLPAAARAVETADDLGRRNLGLLYGFNTLGAVTGAALSTFWLIEQFGNRGALWIACGINILVAIAARSLGRAMPDVVECRPTAVEAVSGKASPWFVIAAAAVAGFAFMLMELVWYRMLSPILGGSTFTFGLILVIALLGVGLGGAAYSMFRSNRCATVSGFALTCGLEAALIALPFALGDRIAHFALMLRQLGALGFHGEVLGWALVTAAVVLPAAAVAGYQFPMLIALLGQGSKDVGRQTGSAYAANTAGAIAGSLLGGFGLLPLLTAPGTWCAIVILLATLAVTTLLIDWRRSKRFSAAAFVAALSAVAMLTATGPTAAWRHSGIGAGRADLGGTAAVNRVKDFTNQFRRTTVWEAEGVESSVGILNEASLAFVINGKVDGNSRGDAGTQIMSGMTGAILHGNARRALVIGLGTGSTAGWLAAIPGMERVDVAELEPAVIEVARRCAAVNQKVLENPKVKIHIGDAREVLLTSSEKYDLIFSEPSNPYRAGIASLFTAEFYAAVTKRLATGGVFLQWLQAYDIDGEAIRSVYATLGSVFPHVETWRTQTTDLLLVATREPLELDAQPLRERIATEPYRSALEYAWRVDSLEGFLSHFVARDGLTRAIIAKDGSLCTDDRNALEFGFARGVGRRKGVKVAHEVVQAAIAREVHQPLIKGTVDWDSVAAQQATAEAIEGSIMDPAANESSALAAHRRFFGFFFAKNFEAAAELARTGTFTPMNSLEIEAAAYACAAIADERAADLMARFKAVRPHDAEAVRARWHVQRREWAAASTALQAVFVAWQTDPWPRQSLVFDALEDALEVGKSCGEAELAKKLFDVLEKPFAIANANERRLAARVILAKCTEVGQISLRMREAVDAYGKHPLWNHDFLNVRRLAYRDVKDPRAGMAARDLYKFMAREPVRFDF